MDIDLVEKLMEEFFPSLQALEAQSAALLQLLKEKGTVTDEELAPYLKQAASASSVRWRAERVRIKGMISSAMRSEQDASNHEAAPLERKGKAASHDENRPKDDNTSPERRDAAHEDKPAEAGSGTRVNQKTNQESAGESKTEKNQTEKKPTGNKAPDNDNPGKDTAA